MDYGPNRGLQEPPDPVQEEPPVRSQQHRNEQEHLLPSTGPPPGAELALAVKLRPPEESRLLPEV